MQRTMLKSYCWLFLMKVTLLEARVTAKVKNIWWDFLGKWKMNCLMQMCKVLYNNETWPLNIEHALKCERNFMCSFVGCVMLVYLNDSAKKLRVKLDMRGIKFLMKQLLMMLCIMHCIMYIIVLSLSL